MMPNNNEMEKVKMYAVVDGEYREVMELQGEITLSECDEQLWPYDYVSVVRCKDCIYYIHGELWGRSWGFCDYNENCFDLSVDPESDFCSRGVRKTAESE